ncbi:MAG: hypothetical protein Q9217_004345 [Psora testacea]
MTSELARVLLSKRANASRSLRVLDLCTGTGCISLLLHSLLAPYSTDLLLVGVDADPRAISLARENLQHNIAPQGPLRPWADGQIRFTQGDVFRPDDGAQWFDDDGWDILVSNPPYISPTGFEKTTTRSVRNYEPKGALVPSFNGKYPASDATVGDLFYPQLLEIARKVRAKVLLMEVADMAQAHRVAGLVLEHQKGKICEIWRDWPAQKSSSEAEYVRVQGRDIRVRGEGNGRAVFAWQDANSTP